MRPWLRGNHPHSNLPDQIYHGVFALGRGEDTLGPPLVPGGLCLARAVVHNAANVNLAPEVASQ
jgi:hypothetical protein